MLRSWAQTHTIEQIQLCVRANSGPSGEQWGVDLARTGYKYNRRHIIDISHSQHYFRTMHRLQFEQQLYGVHLCKVVLPRQLQTHISAGS